MKKPFKILLIALIYLSGYYCSYQYRKSTQMIRHNKWTVLDRKVALAVSSFSWIAVFANAIDNISFAKDEDYSTQSTW